MVRRQGVKFRPYFALLCVGVRQSDALQRVQAVQADLWPKHPIQRRGWSIDNCLLFHECVRTQVKRLYELSVWCQISLTEF